MDHLETPPNFHVRYLGLLYQTGTHNRKDHCQRIHEFLQYPERHGYEVTSSHKCVAKVPKPGDSAQLDVFLQSWLFFGLIEAVLGPCLNGERPDEIFAPFLDDRSQPEYINTTRLLELLERWRKYERGEKESGDKAEQQLRMINIQRALDCSRRIVTSQCALGEHEWPNPDNDSVSQDRKLLDLSLIVLGETLATAKACIVEELQLGIQGWQCQKSRCWGTSSFIIEAMIASNWCPRAVFILKGQVGGNTITLLAAYMLPPVLGNERSKHKDCTKDHCKKADMDRDAISKYKPKCHCGKCGPTDLTGPNVDEVVRIIKDNRIPLLQLHRTSPNPKPKWEVLVQQYGGEKYAAISHVWSDGYGSNKENRLYQCQLGRLSKALEKVPAETAQNGNDNNVSMWFWMDSFAVPADPKYQDARKESIRTIHDVFKNSYHTIVMDGVLSKRNHRVTEMPMRILTSGWMTRLWTLLEAYLSRKLLIDLDTKSMNLDELPFLPKGPTSPLIPSAFDQARAYIDGAVGRERLRRNQDERFEVDSTFIGSVWKAAQWRSTSHPQHETLALAALLNLAHSNRPDAESLRSNVDTSAEPIREMDRDTNMRNLLSLIEAVYPRTIPPGMIFLPPPRLKVRGFGWAPQSWMNANQIDHPDPLSFARAENFAEASLSDDGFLVQFPGFRLIASNGEEENILMSNGVALQFPTDSSMTKWYGIRKADKMDPKDPNMSFNTSGEKFAIIVPQIDIRGEEEIGLMVRLRDEEKSILRVYIVFRVWVKQDTGSTRPDFPKVIGEELGAEQQWRVDAFTQEIPVKPTLPRRIKSLFTSIPKKFSSKPSILMK